MAKAKEKAPDRPKKGHGRNVGFYVSDPTVEPMLLFLAKKWWSENKIRTPTKSAAFAYMVHNFGDAAKRPPENGSFHLDPDHRKRMDLIRDVWGLTKEVPSGKDEDIIARLIDTIYKPFADDQFLDHYVRHKMGLTP